MRNYSTLKCSNPHIEMSSMDQRALLSKLRIQTGQRMKPMFPFTVSRKCCFTAFFIFAFFFSLNNSHPFTLPPHPTPQTPPPRCQCFHKLKEIESVNLQTGKKKKPCFHWVLSGEAIQGFHFGPQSLLSEILLSFMSF